MRRWGLAAGVVILAVTLFVVTLLISGRQSQQGHRGTPGRPGVTVTEHPTGHPRATVTEHPTAPPPVTVSPHPQVTVTHTQKARPRVTVTKTRHRRTTKPEPSHHPSHSPEPRPTTSCLLRIGTICLPR